MTPPPGAASGGDRLASAVILLIGLHSCALGLLMLLLPGTMLPLLGFGEPVPPFFPSQSGIFLLILGVLYLWALAERALVRVIVVSKALAVGFLVVHAAFLEAPPLIWAAAAGDGAMLAAILLVLRRRPPDHPGA